MKEYTCSKCHKEIDGCEAYEYRGAVACEECFDSVIETRDFQRQEIITEESAKTDKFKGLDLGDNVIGKANREILKGSIEIASKESGRLKEYENRKAI
tara:strand:- start:126 stop:419 length:294 start_codon:yes stop_codon:yes gene_type:complete